MKNFDKVEIHQEVIDFFISCPLPLFHILYKIAYDPSHSMYIQLERQLNLINQELIQETKNGSLYKSLFGNIADYYEDRRVKIWLLEQKLKRKIPEERLKELIKATNETIPKPYQLPAISDLPIQKNHLVPLKDFTIEGNALTRKSMSFTVLPPIEKINSQYCLIEKIVKNNLKEITKVRLDPFLIQPASNFQTILDKMPVYGRKLDWERIVRLNDEDHGRWEPSIFSTRSRQTDYVWTPRNGEIHFQCEELPLKDKINTRGSRYFHAIYKLDTEEIIHLDGAICIYNDSEWERRINTPLRKKDKIGKRIKIFLIDSPVPRDILWKICPAFFNGNLDVAHYFGAEIPSHFL